MNLIVQDVEVAEAALEQYLAALRTVNGGGLTLRLEQAASIGSAEQVYPEIWSRLDRARHTAASTGRDLSHYDAIRAYIGTSSAHGITSKRSEVSALVVGVLPVMAAGSITAEGDETGVRAARDAIASFRNAFPDYEWRARDAAPVPELRTGQGMAKLVAVIGAVLGAGVFLAFKLGAI